MCIKGRHARTHADGDKATMYKKKPRSLTLVLDSFVPSARVMDREKIAVSVSDGFKLQILTLMTSIKQIVVSDGLL